VSDDFSEYTSEDSKDWDNLGSFFAPSGIRRMIVQLLRKLDKIKLHWRRHAKR
jgi:hypothetical protein